jgi:hypothetical protein
MMINYAIKKLEQANMEMKVLNYFRTVINDCKEDFKQRFKALNPFEKYKVYMFIYERDKNLAYKICEIMAQKTVSFKIGG